VCCCLLRRPVRRRVARPRTVPCTSDRVTRGPVHLAVRLTRSTHASWELEVHQTSSMSERTGWTESSTMRSAAPTGRLRPHSRRRRGKLALLVMMGVLGRAEARVRADVFTEGLPPIYDADAPNHVRPLAHQL
jgi:hypothetical protein